jgi:hypothetical protein
MKRIGRWILPATAVTGALVAILSLAANELLSDGVERRPHSTSAAPAPVKPTETPRVAAVEAAPHQATLLAPPPSTSGPIESRPIVLPQPVAKKPKVKETAQVLSATGTLGELARMATLQERLRAIDGLKDRLPNDQAVSTLEGLLDSNLPGDFYEAETLRLYLIARLGELPGPHADAALIARTDPEKPRPQRLVAIEMLAGRPDAGRSEIELIARNDHDLVVQDKARWALARAH